MGILNQLDTLSVKKKLVYGIIKLQGSYIDGIKNGKWLWNYENNVRQQEGEFKDGVKVGEWKSFYNHLQVSYGRNSSTHTPWK